MKFELLKVTIPFRRFQIIPPSVPVLFRTAFICELLTVTFYLHIPAMAADVPVVLALTKAFTRMRLAFQAFHRIPK